MQYRIGVRRRFLPFWKTYTVIGHTTEAVGDGARLVLLFPDGGRLAMPRIDRHWMKVYPEFEHYKQRLAQETAAKNAVIRAYEAEE